MDEPLIDDGYFIPITELIVSVVCITVVSLVFLILRWVRNHEGENCLSDGLCDESNECDDENIEEIDHVKETTVDQKQCHSDIHTGKNFENSRDQRREPSNQSDAHVENEKGTNKNLKKSAKPKIEPSASKNQKTKKPALKMSKTFHEEGGDAFTPTTQLLLTKDEEKEYAKRPTNQTSSYLLKNNNKSKIERAKAGATYDPVYKSPFSLESCEGDTQAPFIHFSSHLVYENALQKLNYKGEWIRTPAIPMYFNHVLASFNVSLFRETEDTLTFMAFCGIGPHLTMGESKNRFLYDQGFRNNPPGIEAPYVEHVEISIYDENGKISMTMPMKRKPSYGDYFDSKSFTLSQFEASSKNGVDFHCEVHLYVKRSYFSIEQSIKTRTLVPVTDESEQRMRRILNGERLGMCTWEIITPDEFGESLKDVGRFHVDEHRLMRCSPQFESAIRHGTMTPSISVGKEARRMFLHKCVTEDMKVLIPFIYGERVPLLSSWERVGKIYKAFDIIDGEKVFSVIVPDWEHEIVKRTLGINPRSDTPATYIEILSFLNVIWAVPYGLMPLAKRVCIGVFANMIHLHYPDTDNLEERLLKKIRDYDRDLAESDFMPSILSSAFLHWQKVRSVRKEGVASIPK